MAKAVDMEHPELCAHSGSFGGGGLAALSRGEFVEAARGVPGGLVLILSFIAERRALEAEVAR